MEILISAAVSLIVQVAKKWLGTSKIKTYIFLFVVSFAGAGIMMLLQTVGLWETFLQIAISASGIYGLLIKPVQDTLEK